MKLQHRSLVICATAITAVLLLLSMPSNHYGVPKSEIMSKSGICADSIGDLNARVWSHRAYAGVEYTDGSKAAVQYLLQNGVRNFDVDVSCAESADGSCEFVVAHPSAAAARTADIQTVSAFLLQIYDYAKDQTAMQPLVTLEPKFAAQQQHLDLVKLVQSSPMAHRVAIIGADPESLSEIVNGIWKGGIAAAYRTLPKTDHDYRWPGSPSALAAATNSEAAGGVREIASTGSDTGENVLLLPLLAYGRAATGTTSLAHDSAVGVAVVRQDQTLQLTRPLEDPPLLQIYMPDAKLVKHPIRYAQNSIGGGVGYSDHKERRLVVSWVVDDAEVMWDLLHHKHVNAVISNQPIAMLQALRAAYRKHC